MTRVTGIVESESQGCEMADSHVQRPYGGKPYLAKPGDRYWGDINFSERARRDTLKQVIRELEEDTPLAPRYSKTSAACHLCAMLNAKGAET